MSELELDQSPLNRRARALRLLVEHLRRSWLVELGVFSHTYFLLYTRSVSVFAFKRCNRKSDFSGSAGCVSRNMKYFGYKLVAITTFDGIPLVYDLVPAHTNEREAAEAVVYALRGCHLIGGKGFVGQAWQAKIYAQNGSRIWMPKRSNQ